MHEYKSGIYKKWDKIEIMNILTEKTESQNWFQKINKNWKKVLTIPMICNIMNLQ